LKKTARRETMGLCTVALFGEAEKGEYHTPYLCKTLSELVKYFGNPPTESLGLHLAIQAILYERNLIFFRVEEEGYSTNDYLTGVTHLKEQNMIGNIAAICMPGVGTHQILSAVKPICAIYHSILITNEKDLYDYLTIADIS